MTVVLGGSTLVLQGTFDIRVKGIVWILNDFVFHLFGVVGFPATRRSTDWVRLGVGFLLGQSVDVIELHHPGGILMMKLVLSELKAVSSSDHIALKLWRVVIEGLLSWVEWWLLEDEVPVVADNFLGDWEILVVLLDILVICTPVGNWVVHVVAWILLWVLVLVATGRGANRIRLSIKLEVLDEVDATNLLAGSWIVDLTVDVIESIELIEYSFLLKLAFKRFIIIVMSLNESRFILEMVSWRDGIWITIKSIILLKSECISLIQEAQDS